MDLRLGEEIYDSFIDYRKRIVDEFDTMTEEFELHAVEAARSFQEVNRELKQGILAVLEDEEPEKEPRCH